MNTHKIVTLTPTDRAKIKPVVKACWWNALKAGRYFAKKYPRQDIYYVEGWAVMREFGIPFEHGWLSVDLRDADGVLYQTLTVETTSREAHQHYEAACMWPIDTAARLERKARRLGLPLGGYPNHLFPAQWEDAMVRCHAIALGQTEAAVRTFLRCEKWGGR